MLCRERVWLKRRQRRWSTGLGSGQRGHAGEPGAIAAAINYDTSSSLQGLLVPLTALNVRAIPTQRESLHPPSPSSEGQMASRFIPNSPVLQGEDS